MQTEATPDIKRPSPLLKIGRIVLKTILFLVLFVVVIFLLILTPPVQRFLTGRAESFLQNKLKTRVDIGSVGFGLSGNVHLNDVYIEDLTKDTLLSGGSVKANVALFKLINGEVIVEDLRLDDITAKISRVLPDTVFNFQFIVDAFAPKTTTVDTTTSAPMKIALDKLTLNNIVFQLKDDVTGNDMRVRIGGAEARMDSINPTAFYYDIPSFTVTDLTARIKQTKGLLTPEPASKDMAEAADPVPMQIRIGTVDLSKISLDYANDVSALYTTLNLGHLRTTGRRLDLTNNTVHLEDLILENTTAALRMGKTAGAQVVKEETAKELEAEQTQGWDFRVANIRLNNNNIKFDDDNQPRTTRGMDYAHLNAKGLTLHADNFIMSTDTIATKIVKGEMAEQSGFVLQELRGDLLYAYNGAHLKDLYIKTPGTELKRDLVLKYSSYEALTNNFPQTAMDIDIRDSRVQVKDILTFAPQLAAQPAFRNASDVWQLNLQAQGNMENLNVGSLRFAGFGNTSIDASGTLANLTEPAKAGANFTIRKLHTTKSDLNLLSGGALPPTINLPQSIDLDGTIKGNMGTLATAMNLRTTMGSAAINGTFSNITDPAKARYDATVKAAGLQLGSILANPQLGNLTGTFKATGTGFTPDAMNLRFAGNVVSAGFNGYNYRNISANGTLKGTDFTATLISRDANAALSMNASGDYGGSVPSIKLDGVVDSLKLMPLGFTPEPVIFRGKIVGDLPSIDPNNLEADLSITEALLVAGENRLTLDTLQLTAGRSDSGQFVRVASDIVSASIEGQYQLTELATVIQNTINPYFSFGPTAALPAAKPYDFTFLANMVYDPVLASFVPGFTAADPIRAEGRLATGQGMQASVVAPYVLFGTNEIRDVNLAINTTDSLDMKAVVGLVKSGTAIQMHNVQMTAAALANNLNFDLTVDDPEGKQKYELAGLFQMPQSGDMVLSLRPGSIMLNYDPWTVPNNNSISIGDSSIIAQAFTLLRGNQSLSLQSQDTTGNAPLDVRFANFKVATLTGFVQQDSLLVDGTLNGIATLNNLMTDLTFTSDLTLSDLSFKQDTLGNLAMKISSEGTRYNANVTLKGRGNDLAVTGFAEQAADAFGLNLDLAIRSIDLATLEGASAGMLTNASGYISGDVAIRGTTAKPDIQGEVEFNDASITTAMLGGPLRIDNEAIAVTSKGILFDNFTIRDSANNRLDLNGDVLTDDFLSYRFDLDVEARNFKAVSSTKKVNQLFYGDMVVSTDLHIGGTQAAPVVDGSLTVDDGTAFTFVLPQAEPGVVDREGVIQFVDFDAPENDSLFLTGYDSLNTSSITGLDVAINLEIVKEAVFNIVVDEASGDFLNVRGAAQLSTGIDPSGKITMTGTYEIEEGAYELSFNFLRRRFEIQKGSKMTWLGEPTNAQVDVTAVYVANTAPLDLVESFLTESTASLRNRYLQKLPFQVLLQMDGELLKPVLTFDIKLPTDRNYNVASDVISTVDTRLLQLRQEPSELNKQVFAVLLLNRFVGENPFQSSGGGFNAGAAARQSVSKLLTEQLNQLASGLVQGVDLNFDVASADDYTTGERRDRTDLNVGLSKRLLNDRLQVTVGSNFELEGPQQSGQQGNNIAGNVSLQYQLSRDGRYMLRAYRKNEYQGVVDGYIIETGLGFIITLDYNHFRELFRKKPKTEEPLTEPTNEQKTDSTNAQ